MGKIGFLVLFALVGCSQSVNTQSQQALMQDEKANVAASLDRIESVRKSTDDLFNDVVAKSKSGA